MWKYCFSDITVHMTYIAYYVESGFKVGGPATNFWRSMHIKTPSYDFDDIRVQASVCAFGTVHEQSALPYLWH